MAGSRKCWFACSPAITKPLIEKIKVETRFIRINWDSQFLLFRGRTPVQSPTARGLRGPANKATTIARTPVTRKARFAT